MERIDTTDPDRKLRFMKRLNGRRLKTRVWFDKTGAKRKPQKTRDQECYDLRSWTQPGRFAGTRIVRPGRK